MSVRFISFVLTIFLALSGAEAFAQSAGRAASGEKRTVDKKSDAVAYELMKSHVNSELGDVVELSEEEIRKFNGGIEEISEELVELRILLDALLGSLTDEDDPSIKTPKMADTRLLASTSVPVCNPQTQEIYFNNNNGRWSCESGASGCMASQNVWR